VRDERAGEERELVADFVAGCDGAHSTVRELLGIRMLGNPALTYTTNIIFRCADLAARHPGRKPYRYILLGPEGTWATIVAINGGDQWRMSIIGGETPRDLSTDNIMRPFGARSVRCCNTKYSPSCRGSARSWSPSPIEKGLRSSSATPPT
jgi:2-polyprenyl-6-methoxyphenol hydroxylase and related FAD-dependent oxidoreductases